MSRRFRARGFSGAALGLSVTAALAVATPAAASPSAAPAPSVVARHTLTLITGDVVDLQTRSDGNSVASLRPSADRPNVSYASHKVGKDLYLIPSDAMAMIAAGALDDQLFNLTALVDTGYDDSHSTSLPLIVQYDPARARSLAPNAAPAGSTAKLALPSIGGQSVQEGKRTATTFWNSVSGLPPTHGPASGASLTEQSSAATDGAQSLAAAPPVRKIWLNRKVSVTLSDSVPQVGAPAAWAAGFDGTGVKVAVLDTGIDTTHPDLDGGKVVAAQNFSDDADTADHFGHGTHVASIVAGKGVGSTVVRKGVAPGANLINAKVLNSSGNGTFDQIIAGLQWAADQGAQVANMSLGTNAPSDGKGDPLIQAVDSISKSTNMLVVIAAGNLGPADGSIASPGWADEALTVGAVDKHDGLAGFSSRGPRQGDFGIKPDISGPGVDIIAARAAGTNLGPIVDGNYQMLSGTSMATPHVAGAAAILAQRFPQYTNHQLKDTLISTSKTIDGQTVYQQGGGRLDVARGYAQQVYASPGTLNLGFFPFPHTSQDPVTKTVTYTNDTAADVTLNLSLQLSGKDSGPAPAGMFAVSQPTVTVPAGGSAPVTVTLNPAAGPLDRYGGYLVATSGNVVVHTTLGAFLEPEMHNLTVNGIARDGRPAAVISFAELWSLQTGQFTQLFYSQTNSSVTFRVPPGTYNLAAYLATADASNAFALELAVVSDPQVEVTADRTITLDARTANQVVLNTPKPTAPTTFTLSYHRDMNDLNFHSSFTLSPPIARGYASPTATVSKGNFEFYSRWDLVAPPLLAKVTKPQEIPLDPQPMSNALPVDGKHTLPVIYVGLGKPEDYVGRDLHGKIALISRGETTFASKIVNATAAGAYAAVIFNNRPGLLLAGAGDPGTVSIRGLTIEQSAGQMLLGLLQQGPVTMQLSGTAVSPYFYDLLLPEKQRVPANLNYTISKANTAQLNTSYAADVPGTLGTDVRHISRPWPTFSVGFTRDIPRPLERTYFVSANDTRWWHIAWSHTPFDGEFDSAYTMYTPRQNLSESWFGRVARPGASGLFGTQVSRTGDDLDVALFPYSDSGGHFGFGAAGDAFNTKLYNGTTLLSDTNSFPFGTLGLSAAPGTYRLVLNAKRSNAWSTYSTETNTTWTFASSRPADGATEHPALMQVDYDLALDSFNRAPDQGGYTFSLNVGHIPGAGSDPALKKVQAWVSFNDGGTWKRIDLSDDGDGAFLATVEHPKLANTTGAVSLRVLGTDKAGNSVDQTLLRAYGLRSSD